MSITQEMLTEQLNAMEVKFVAHVSAAMFAETQRVNDAIGAGDANTIQETNRLRSEVVATLREEVAKNLIEIDKRAAEFAEKSASLDKDIEYIKTETKRVTDDINGKLATVSGKEKILDDKLTQLHNEAEAFKITSDRQVTVLRELEGTVMETQTEMKAVQFENETMVTNEFKRFDSHCDIKIREIATSAGAAMGSLQDQIQGIDAKVGVLQSQSANVPGAGGSGGSFKVDTKLCDRKDMELKELPENVDRESFVFWRKRFGVRMTTISTWENVPLLLEKLQSEPEEANRDMVIKHMAAINEEKGQTFNLETFNFGAAANELYMCLTCKLNKDLTKLCKDIQPYNNGFEVWRMISMELDPVVEGTEFTCYDRIMMMAYQPPAKNVVDSRKRLIVLNSAVCDYEKVSKKSLVEEAKLHVIMKMMDVHTRSKLEMRADLTKDKRTFKGVGKFIESQYLEKQSDDMFKGGPSPMDTSSLAAMGQQAQQQQAQPLDDEAEAWMQFLIDQGRVAPPTLDEGDQMALDAFRQGKGGGKGNRPAGKGGYSVYQGFVPQGGQGAQARGAKKPLVCWQCEGEGHPESICPTKKGSTDVRKCNVCKGKGHFGADCTSPGGGKHQPRAPKGGGKGARRPVSGVEPGAGTTYAAPEVPVDPWMGPPSENSGWATAGANGKATADSLRRPMSSLMSCKVPTRNKYKALEDDDAAFAEEESDVDDSLGAVASFTITTVTKTKKGKKTLRRSKQKKACEC